MLFCTSLFGKIQNLQILELKSIVKNTTYCTKIFLKVCFPHHIYLRLFWFFDFSGLDIT